MVSDFDSGNVQIFSVATNQLLATIQAGASPATGVISPDGRFAYVPNLNSNYLSVLDLTIGAEITRIHDLVDFGVGVNAAVITPDGTQVIVPAAPGVLAIIHTADFSVTRVPLPPICDDAVPAKCDADPNDLHIIALAVAANKVYLNLDTSFPVRVVCIDLNDLSVSTVPGTAVGSNFSVNSITVTPDGRFVIAKRAGPRRLIVIDTGTNTVSQIFMPSIRPGQLVATPARGASGGVFVYLLGLELTSDTVVVQAYAMSDGMLSMAGSVSLFSFTRATRLALSPDSTLLYVSMGSSFTVLDTHAIISNPAGAVLSQSTIGNFIAGIATGAVQLQPAATAPSLTSVAPALILNNDTDGGRTIQINGINFSPDVRLRIGNLDPFASGGASTSSLQAIVPASAPAQIANIIVTNPNSGSPVSGQNQSGILRGQFVIASPPTFQPVNQTVVANFGNSTAAILNVSANAGVLPTISGVLGAQGVAITADGERAYIGQFGPPAVTVINLVQNQIEDTVNLDGSVLGQVDGVVVRPSPVFDGPVAYTIASIPLNDGNSDQELFVIDANPAHFGTTLNKVIATQRAGQDLPFGYSGAIAATPDGRYIYGNALQSFCGPGGWLIIYDVVSGTSNTIPASILNIAGCQLHIEISPDGTSLLLNGVDGNIYVFDISADPMNPALLAIITATSPAHFSATNLPALRIPANQPNRLYAFDPTQNLAVAFNFDRATPNFSQLGAVLIPGLPSPLGGSGLEVTPDGSLVYALLNPEDNVAVLDGRKIANSDSTALLTKLVTGLGPSSIAVRPGTPTPLSTASNPVVNVTPTLGITISFSNVTSTGATTATTTNTTLFSAPAGFQISGIPVYYEISTTATFSNAVVCFQYDPNRVPGPEASLRLAHYDRASDPVTGQVIGWEDVTVPGSPDTATHTICGQISSFSPFVIGIASVDFLFNSLLVDISSLSSAVTPVGVMRSLRAKALAARTSADKGKQTSAQNQMNALINQLQAISGKQISPADANTVISEANAILSRL